MVEHVAAMVAVCVGVWLLSTRARRAAYRLGVQHMAEEAIRASRQGSVDEAVLRAMWRKLDGEW